MPSAMLPWWQVNVPDDLRTDECPDFLQECGEKDRRIIGTPDSQYRPYSWEEVKDIIKTNRIDKFVRKPSELRRYRHYTWELVRNYGSIMDFVLKERLQWTDLTPRGHPFTHSDDIKILHNDWPYGVDERIVHLVVWTKFELEDDPATDDLTPEARQMIDNYVDKTFCTRVNAEQVIWFKNWKSLKSVHAVEHFHVMLYNPDLGFIEEITNGDVPLSKKAPAV
ncbi:N-acetylglucosamine-induced protein 1 [Lasiodiplodia hormozganensis]|uniref:N-acetylglucosamine-induced protein 1 n=1 Tax=Lasiodiplodia hormozganensis TaxID=869390 RepID=A0AA40D809_9PEZI|nr:N-acetylglucosamine-induced protein 1 [Lasiodiplodia hormozganensis]